MKGHPLGVPRGLRGDCKSHWHAKEYARKESFSRQKRYEAEGEKAEDSPVDFIVPSLNPPDIPPFITSRIQTVMKGPKTQNHLSIGPSTDEPPSSKGRGAGGDCLNSPPSEGRCEEIGCSGGL